jgi:cysteine desulfuration protein SufE
VFNGEMSVTSAEKAVLKGSSIGMDKSRAIKEAENEYAQLKQELDSQTRRLNEVKKERHGQKVKWNDWKKKLTAAQAQINKYTEDIERIREESENAENITFDTSELEDEVNKAQEQYDKLKMQLEEISKSIEDLTPDIEKIQSEIEEEFGFFDDWMDKYEHLIGLGKDLPLIDPKFKTEEHIIKGCQSQVWLQAELEDGKLFYTADSDAIITKGVISLLIRSFNAQSPEAILEANTDFIDRIGLKDHLSPTRANGLVSMVKQMKFYALAFKAKTQNT